MGKNALGFFSGLSQGFGSSYTTSRARYLDNLQRKKDRAAAKKERDRAYKLKKKYYDDLEAERQKKRDEQVDIDAEKFYLKNKELEYKKNQAKLKNKSRQRKTDAYVAAQNASRNLSLAKAAKLKPSTTTTDGTAKRIAQLEADNKNDLAELKTLSTGLSSLSKSKYESPVLEQMENRYKELSEIIESRKSEIGKLKYQKPEVKQKARLATAKIGKLKKTATPKSTPAKTKKITLKRTGSKLKDAGIY